MNRLFVIVLSNPPPVSADLRLRAKSIAVVEAHLRVLGYELRPTLATRIRFWWHTQRRPDAFKGGDQ